MTPQTLSAALAPVIAEPIEADTTVDCLVSALVAARGSK